MGNRGLGKVGGVVLVAVTAAACGTGTFTPGQGASSNGASGASPKTAVEQAFAATAGASSYSLSMSFDLTGPSSHPGTGAGASSAASSSAAALPILKRYFQISLTGGYSKALDAFQASVSVPGFGTESFIYDGAAHLVYFKLPSSLLSTLKGAMSAPGALGGGSGEPAAARSILEQIVDHPASWLEIDLSRLGKNSQLPAGAFNFSGYDPAKMVGALDGAISDVATAGAATVAGVTTTEYKVTLNLQRAVQNVMQILEQSMPGASKSLPQGLPAVLKGLPTAMAFQVYVDQSGYERQLTATIPLGGIIEAVMGSMRSVLPSSGAPSPAAAPSPTAKELAGFGVSFTIGYSNFGSSSDVVVPASGDVIDISPLMETAPKATLGML